MEMKENELFDGKYITLIPEHFNDMPQELINIKYPLNGRPQIVKSDIDYKSDFKFSLLDVETDMDIVSYLKDNTKKLILSSNASYHYKEDIVIKDERGKLIAGFSFTNQVLDGVAYNVICYKQFGREIINMSMSCPTDKVDSLLEHFKNSLYYLKRKN